MRRAVEMWLRWKELDRDVVITAVEKDRVYGWPLGPKLFEYCIRYMEVMDMPHGADLFHGGTVSFREDAVPSMQIVFHRGNHSPPFVEMDLDMYPPSWKKPWRMAAHCWHVLLSAVIGRKPYGEDRLIKALEKRIRRETGN